MRPEFQRMLRAALCHEAAEHVALVAVGSRSWQEGTDQTRIEKYPFRCLTRDIRSASVKRELAADRGRAGQQTVHGPSVSDLRRGVSFDGNSTDAKQEEETGIIT